LLFLDSIILMVKNEALGVGEEGGVFPFNIIFNSILVFLSCNFFKIN
jgi:hypothetical protein